MSKYRVEAQVTLIVEAGSEDDLPEAVEEVLTGDAELVAINNYEVSP